ncbi:MAG TPA: DUF3794 domain-containing protein [Clostridiales bacterium]|nr:DUF3794 domain-containing protein [Clostridiales bacterium]
MSLDLAREVIKVSNIINREITQIIVENDIIVPDTKPDVVKILIAEAEAYTTSAVVNTDEKSTFIKGIIRYKILYKPDDPDIDIKSININAEFSHEMDTPVAGKDVRNIVKCLAEHVECEIINGRKINTKTILQLNSKVMAEEEYVLINDISDNGDIQVLRNNMEINNFIGSSEALYTIKESMEVPEGNPPIREILSNDVKIINKDFRLSDNKVIVTGEMNIVTLYAGDDQESSIRLMEHATPFTQFVDLSGINDESDCEIGYEVRDYSFEAAEDADGELRVMNMEVEVSINVYGSVRKNIDIVHDAYGLRSGVTLDKKVVKTEEKVTENISQAVLKDTATIGEGNPEIVEIINMVSKPVLTDYKVQEDKIEIEGFVANNLIYLSNNSEQNMSCLQSDIPLKQTIDIKGVKPGMACEIELLTEHANYSMLSSKDVELRLVVGVVSKVYKNVEKHIIEKAIEIPFDESRKADKKAGIIVYFIQPGDTLWEIAKKYTTTVNDIQRVNMFQDQDSIDDGMQILITRKS